MATVALSGIITPTNVVTATSTTTLTNKTLTAPTIASANLTTALTLAGAAGTNGQVLTSAGSGLPSWTTVGSGALTFLSTVTASASATVDIETTFSSTYDAYLLVATGVTVATNSAPIACRMKIGGSYITTSTYVYHGTQLISSGAGYASSVSAGAGAIRLLDNVGSAANRLANFSMFIYAPASTAFSKMITWDGGALSETGAQYKCTGSGHNTGTGALTGIRIFTDGNGNVNAGTFRLYGIANS